jgi:hypothetical protein
MSRGIVSVAGLFDLHGMGNGGDTGTLRGKHHGLPRARQLISECLDLTELFHHGG